MAFCSIVSFLPAVRPIYAPLFAELERAASDVLRILMVLLYPCG
jgi:hypothetical protein